MPLTSAERSKRYRERLQRENPDKLEAQRLKNLQRIKSKKKKVSQMTQEEAEKKRKVWREEKRVSRQKQKKSCQGMSHSDSIVAHNDNTDNTDSSVQKSLTQYKKSVRNMKNKITYLMNKCRRFMTYNKKLINHRDKYKKRYQRLQNKKEKEINNLKTKLMKAKAREEILENTMKKTYQSCSKRPEKQSLKRLVKNSENKGIVTKMLGIKGKIRENTRKTRPNQNVEITAFYMRDDISRNTAGKTETRTKNKNKKQIRYLCDTLVNTFKKYRNEGGRVGFTTFYKNKPFFILSPKMNSRSTCLCPKHSNIDFLHTALLKRGIISGTRREALENICCDTNNYNCMYNTCRQCKDNKVQFNLATEEQLNQEVQWLQWERKEHIYEKKDEGTKKEVKTMRTEKVTNKGSINDLKKKYENDLILFKKHHFNNVHQQKEYQKAVSELQDNECLIVCDFSESYEAKLANEVQSMHFGASKRQISLHTGMVYWKDEVQSFCTISDESSHQPPAIWAHLSPVIEMIKERSPNVEILHFYTDGPSSQYRQKNNFYLLAHFTKTYGFKYSTWSFYEAHHGKSVADGIGGSVKRNLDKKVCLGIDVVDAKDAYDISKECLKKTKVFLILKSDIANISKILPAKLPILKGSMQLHQIITDEIDKTKIAYRDVSCFCGDLRGQCDCFSPKSHSVVEQRPTRDGMRPPDSCPSTSTAQDDMSLAKNTPNTDGPKGTEFVSLDLDNCEMRVGINVAEQYKIETPINIHQSVIDIQNNYHSKIETTPNTEISERATLGEIKFNFSTDLNEYMAEPNFCEQDIEMIDMSQLPIIAIQQEESQQPLVEPSFKNHLKIEPIHNIETSERDTRREIGSSCFLPLDLKDCAVQPILDEQADEIIDMNEFPMITLQQREEHVPTIKNRGINYLSNQDGNNNPVTPAKIKLLAGNNYARNNVSVKNCSPETDTVKRCKNKIQILEVKTFRPKQKKLAPVNSRNRVAKNVPGTELCKSKIQTKKGLECLKCSNSILGQKSRCMICKKWYCSECVGQQIPDYICDPCLES